MDALRLISFMITQELHIGQPEYGEQRKKKQWHIVIR